MWKMCGFLWNKILVSWYYLSTLLSYCKIDSQVQVMYLDPHLFSCPQKFSTMTRRSDWIFHYSFRQFIQKEISLIKYWPCWVNWPSVSNSSPLLVFADDWLVTLINCRNKHRIIFVMEYSIPMLLWLLMKNNWKRRRIGIEMKRLLGEPVRVSPKYRWY